MACPSNIPTLGCCGDVPTGIQMFRDDVGVLGTLHGYTKLDYNTGPATIVLYRTFSAGWTDTNGGTASGVWEMDDDGQERVISYTENAAFTANASNFNITAHFTVGSPVFSGLKRSLSSAYNAVLGAIQAIPHLGNPRPGSRDRQFRFYFESNTASLYTSFGGNTIDTVRFPTAVCQSGVGTEIPRPGGFVWSTFSDFHRASAGSRNFGGAPYGQWQAWFRKTKIWTAARTGGVGAPFDKPGAPPICTWAAKPYYTELPRVFCNGPLGGGDGGYITGVEIPPPSDFVHVGFDYQDACAVGFDWYQTRPVGVSAPPCCIPPIP